MITEQVQTATPEVTPTAAVSAAPNEQIPATEPAPEEKSPSPKEDPKFASKFAALAKRERAAMLREQSLKEQAAKYSTWEAEQKLMEENFLEFAAKKGYTFDKLTQLALNDGKKPPELRIQELEDKLTKKEQEREENEKKALQDRYENQKKSFVNQINDFIEGNKDTYELISVSEEPSELIYNVIEGHYEKTGRILPIKDAVDMVEKHFESELEDKYLSKNKIKSKFAPKEPAPAAPNAPKVPSQTLTNTQGTNVPTPSTQKALSIEESKRAAAQLLKWT